MPELPETIELPAGLLTQLFQAATEAIATLPASQGVEVPESTAEFLRWNIATHPDAQVREWALNELAKKLPGVTK